MRLLFVLNTLDERDGGPPAGVLTLTTALAAAGHEVTVAARHRSQRESVLAEGATAAGVTIIQPARAGGGGLVGLLGRLRPCIRQADLVSLHGFYLSSTLAIGALCRVMKVPYVIQLHGSVEVEQDQVSMGKKALFRKLGGQYVLTGSRALVLATDWEKEHLPAYARNTPAVVTGIAVPRTTGLAKRPEAGEEPVVLFLGRLAEKKRVDLVLQAVAELNSGGLPTRLLIAGAGDGPLEDELRRQASSLGLDTKVEWLGHVSARDKSDILASAHVFCLPSMRENFAVAVAEACSVGLPVVVSGGVALHRLVEAAGAGMVVPTPPTSTELATALRHILTSPSLWESCHEAALRLTANSFGAPTVARRWVESLAT